MSAISLQVEEVEGQVVVKADKRDLLRGRRAPAVLQVTLPIFPLMQYSKYLNTVNILSQVEVNEDEEGMVVIGGGAAGHTAVETLRFTSLFVHFSALQGAQGGLGSSPVHPLTFTF